MVLFKFVDFSISRPYMISPVPIHRKKVRLIYRVIHEVGAVW